MVKVTERKGPISIEIPVRNNEIVEVFCEELPEEVSSITAIIQEEEAPLELFLTFALEYRYRRGDAACEELLRAGITCANERDENEKIHSLRARLMASLAALLLNRHSQSSLSSVSNQSTSEALLEANGLISEAERLDGKEYSVQLCRGILLLLQQRPDACAYQARIILADNPNLIPAQLLLAASAYALGSYNNAASALQALMPRLMDYLKPLAHLLYIHSTIRSQSVIDSGNGAGKEINADTVLENLSTLSSLSPCDLTTNTDANISLAILQINNGVRLVEGLLALQELHRSNAAVPSVQLFLAEHFFQRGNFEKALILAERSCQGPLPLPGGKSLLTNYHTARSLAEAHYIRGKILHSQSISSDTNSSSINDHSSQMASNAALNGNFVNPDKLEAALQAYRTSLDLDATFLPVKVPLARIYLQRGEFDNALALLKKVEGASESEFSKEFGKDVEFWSLYAICAHFAKKDEIAMRALSHLSRPLNNYTMCLLDAQVRLSISYKAVNGTDQYSPLDSLMEAQKLLPQSFNADPFLLNNLAVAFHGKGDLMASFNTFLLLLNLGSTVAGQFDRSPINPSILYNIARLAEDFSDISTAETIYRSLLSKASGKEFALNSIANGETIGKMDDKKRSGGRQDKLGPSFIPLISDFKINDSVDTALTVQVHLRLGIISQSLGQYVEAAEQYKEAIGLDGNCSLAWYHLASLQLKEKALTPARKALERILKEIDRHDRHALVALGNMYINQIRPVKEVTESKRRGESRISSKVHGSTLIPMKKQTEKELTLDGRRALDFFIKALQLNANDGIAAHGVCVVLAASGRFEEARQMLLPLRASLEASSALPGRSHFLANTSALLGSVLVECLQPAAAAATCYQKALSQYPNDRRFTCQTQLLMARAWYAEGKRENDLKCLESASQVLCTINPSRTIVSAAIVLFNIGLVLKAVSKLSVVQSASDSLMDNIERLNRAIALLALSEKIYHELASCNGAKHRAEDNGADSSLGKKAETESLQESMGDLIESKVSVQNAVGERVSSVMLNVDSIVIGSDQMSKRIDELLHQISMEGMKELLSFGVNEKILQLRQKACRDEMASLKRKIDLALKEGNVKVDRLDAVRVEREKARLALEAREAEEKALREKEEAEKEAIRRDMAERLKNVEERVSAVSEQRASLSKPKRTNTTSKRPLKGSQSSTSNDHSDTYDDDDDGISDLSEEQVEDGDSDLNSSQSESFAKDDESDNEIQSGIRRHRVSKHHSKSNSASSGKRGRTGRRQFEDSSLSKAFISSSDEE